MIVDGKTGALEITSEVVGLYEKLGSKELITTVEEVIAADELYSTGVEEITTDEVASTEELDGDGTELTGALFGVLSGLTGTVAGVLAEVEHGTVVRYVVVIVVVDGNVEMNVVPLVEMVEVPGQYVV